MQKKINFTSATLVSVGILIGFGIFFKADDIFILNEGHASLVIISWLLVGMITIFGAYSVGQIVPLVPHADGFATYIEFLFGKHLAYFNSIFMVIIYVPIYLGLLSKMFASYFMDLLGLDSGMYIIAFIVLTIVAIWNFISTKFSVKLSDVATIFKLIPLFAIFIIGLLFGEVSSDVPTTAAIVSDKSTIVLILAPLTAMMLTLDGWISIGALSHRIDDADKNVPRVFVATIAIVLLAYILYFIGIDFAFNIETTDWSVVGNSYLSILVNDIAGQVGVAVVLVLVLISGLGCLNGFYLSGFGYIEAAASKKHLPISDKLVYDERRKGGNPYASLINYFFGSVFLLFYYLQDTSDFMSGVIIDDLQVLFITLFSFILYLGIIKYAISKSYKIKKIVLPAIVALVGQGLIIMSFFVNSTNAFLYIFVTIFGLLLTYVLNKLFNPSFDL